MQSRHRLVQTQHVRPQAARGSAARCSCTALRRRLHPYHGSAGTRASASLLAWARSLTAAAAVNLHLCVRRSGVLGVEMKTLPVKHNVDCRVASALLIHSETRHTLESHTDTHSHSQNHFTHQGGSRPGAVVWKSNSQVLLPVKRHRAGEPGRTRLTGTVLYCIGTPHKICMCECEGVSLCHAGVFF